MACTVHASRFTTRRDPSLATRGGVCSGQWVGVEANVGVNEGGARALSNTTEQHHTRSSPAAATLNSAPRWRRYFGGKTARIAALVAWQDNEVIQVNVERF